MNCWTASIALKESLGTAFPHVPDKEQAWGNLLRLTQDEDSIVRRSAKGLLGTAFPHVSDKEQAWGNLLWLTQDEDSIVRRSAVESFAIAFPHLSEIFREQAWNALIHLPTDEYTEIRISANHSLGRISIFKATEAETEEEFRKEIETAIAFFEASAREVTYYSNPARFCLPFYRSFYTVIFKKQEAETEVQNYLAEAKWEAEGSASKEKLLEAVENLANALREVQDAREVDFDVMKRDLNAYRRYCERAAELLEVTEDKAPGATKLLRKGLPIIDQRIKEILGEIQEKTAEVCRHARGTSLEPLGYEINQAGKNLSRVRDQIGLEKGVENLLIVVSDICAKMSEEERGEACELLERAKKEYYIEDKLPLIGMILSKIPTQLSLEKKLGEIMISIKPKIREELVLTSGITVLGTGGQHVVTIPLQEISYTEFREDWEKIKDKNKIKFANLPPRLAKRVKDYFIRNKKEGLLEQLTGGF